MINKESVLYCTRQTWKLWAMHVGGVIAILLIVAIEWFRSSLPARDHALLMLLGSLLGLGSVAFPCVAVKCPACGARVTKMGSRCSSTTGIGTTTPNLRSTFLILRFMHG
jgi:hypothetical protein